MQWFMILGLLIMIFGNFDVLLMSPLTCVQTVVFLQLGVIRSLAINSCVKSSSGMSKTIKHHLDSYKDGTVLLKRLYIIYVQQPQTNLQEMKQL